jgi:hypothetical protein
MTQLDLMLRYKIEEKDDRLLEMAANAAKNAVEAEGDLKSGQVKALLRQVQVGNGSEHVCNWLRYQSARIEAWSQSGLADVVLSDITTLKAEAKTLIQAIYPEQVEERLPTVWLALVQRYVGYLHRGFVALKGETDED